VITGPLQYVERIPLVGIPIKRELALRFSRRFKYFAQPNVDVDRELVPELWGTLTPGFVAQKLFERYADDAWRQRSSVELRAIYGAHVGASQRMADALAA